MRSRRASKVIFTVGLVGVVGALGLTGCNASEIAQLQALLASAGSGSASGAPSSSGSGSSGSSSDCFYTVSATYDLGPGIDVTQGFLSKGEFGRGIEVVKKVLDSDARGCASGVLLPAVGDSWKASVYSVLSKNGELKLYPSRFSEPLVFRETTSVDSPVTDLFSGGTVGLSLSVPQVAKGNVSQIFDQGRLESATQGSDALMVLQFTYVYSKEID